jgi:glycosyltransferase involved in cell wall biosynthesis
VWRYPSVHTGIQRVTRNIASEAKALFDDVRWSVLDEECDFRLIDAIPQPTDKPFAYMGEKIEFLPGDIYFVLDSTWEKKIMELLLPFKSKGVMLGAMYYDLIPITHNEFTAIRSDVLIAWVRETLKYSDFFACISQFTCETLIKHATGIYPYRKIDDSVVFSFPLGADLPQYVADYTPSDNYLKNAFLGGKTYLMVSTLEPRKNHALLLDAFDIAWEHHPSIKLCFIGIDGWKVEELVKRINAHPLKDKNLFWFQHLNDRDLRWAYSNAHCTLYPSFVEGFGLPIVESLHYGTPVIASDIPVFHEIAGGSIGHCDPKDPESLVKWINVIEENGIPDNLKPTNFKWPTWKESAEILFREIRTRKSAHHASESVASRDIFRFPSTVPSSAIKPLTKAEDNCVPLSPVQLLGNFNMSEIQGVYRRFEGTLQEIRKKAKIKPMWDINSGHGGIRGKLSIGIKKFFRKMILPFLKSVCDKQSSFNSNSSILFESLVSEIIFLRMEVNNLSHKLNEKAEDKSGD